MKNIFDYSLEDLQAYLITNGESKYRASQIFDWLYKKRIDSFFDMQNIKKETIEHLNENFNIFNFQILKNTKDKDVQKYLFALPDQQTIEAVLLKQRYGNSLCVSSQVGCDMGCLFCESGKQKVIRNLTVAELIQQILLIENESEIRISHVVVMGIGEPFQNYNNIEKFIKIINHPKALAIGARHITVSTCGIVPQIYQFAEDFGQVNLAISLHATTNKLRTKLMPINKVYSIEKIIKAVQDYVQKTNRRVTFEYVMLKGINDSKQDAINLVSLLKGINCYVNLIPYNRTSNSQFEPSNKSQILEFYDIIKKNNLNVTIRKELGANVFAACGQLRANYEEEK